MLAELTREQSSTGCATWMGQFAPFHSCAISLTVVNYSEGGHYARFPACPSRLIGPRSEQKCQDHRTVKKRTWLAKGYGSFSTAWRTLQGIETVNMIRKGRVRWVARGDAIAAASFIAELFGVAA